MKEITMQEFLAKLERSDIRSLRVWHFESVFRSMLLMSDYSMYLLDYEKGVAQEVIHGKDTA